MVTTTPARTGHDRQPWIDPNRSSPTGRQWLRTRRYLALTAVVGLCLVVGGASSSAHAPTSGPAADSPAFQPPVVGAVNVVDGFRPPASRFGAGNRAIDLAVGADETIVAPGSGSVAVAGPVFGVGTISIDHPNGLRSVLTQMVSIEVAVGDQVEAGDAVGTATGQVSLSTRAGRAYLNPEILWGESGPPPRSGRARLVPLPSQGID